MNTSIGARIWLAFSTVLTLTLVLGISGWWGASTLVAEVLGPLHEASGAEMATRQATNSGMRLRRTEREWFLALGDPVAQADVLERWTAALARLDEDLDALDVDDPDEEERADELRKHIAAYVEGFEAVREQVVADALTTPQAANAAMSPYKSEIDQFESGLLDAEVRAAREREELQEKIEAIADRTMGVMIGVFLVAIVSCVLAGGFLYRGVVPPILAVLETARAVARGDLERRSALITEGAAETAALSAAITEMSERLIQVLGEVGMGAHAIAAASGQLSSTASEVSEGVSRQASSTQATSASLEELGASVAQAADHTRTMSRMATKSVTDAEESVDAMKQTIAAVRSIAAKIGIIEDIAYQTNILALNAAIEAGRAGDQGRGFAVVAAEVRRLAERSQVAASEISELAEKTCEITDRSGRLLSELVPAIRRTNDIVQEVAASSREQASTNAEIGGQMLRIDTVAQQNAANCEELSAVAVELAAQAATLKDVVGFFRLPSVGAVHAPPKAPLAPRPAVHTHPPVNGHVNGTRIAIKARNDAEFERF